MENNFLINNLDSVIEEIMNQAGIENKNELLRLVMERKIKFSLPEPPKIYREENGIIFYSVISDGTSGPEWYDRLENKGVKIYKYAKEVLFSPEFEPTSGYVTEIAVLRGTSFLGRKWRIRKWNINNAKKIAAKLNLFELRAEDACLTRERITDGILNNLGLYWINPLHKPINGLTIYPSRYGSGNALVTHDSNPHYPYHPNTGFAFGVSRRKLSEN